MVIGLLVIAAIPTVTGIAEGVSHQQKQNEQLASDESRMRKFHMDVYCDSDSNSAKRLNGRIVVVKNNKVYLHPKDPTTLEPLPCEDGSPGPHPFTGFYILYPDEERDPPERGLVSTISVDPPMLNWIYCDNETHELRYGNRTASKPHVVGPWDWEEDEVHVTLEDWEGFLAVQEPDGEWAIYYDRDDDGLASVGLAEREKFECSLRRRVLADEKQNLDAPNDPTKNKIKSEASGGFQVMASDPSRGKTAAPITQKFDGNTKGARE
ncbi:hypothetical protein M501DRAFT_263951 [Patellaria atrata CBS 101060]|uniref:Uncharacterized protein n=1 Tax=Patellaria atrata CBS 101060 TaxID=1346257 RepID=A0A9P4S507_9PEZI|nr:hypothetical protein M501DRAFT_263951 [Patellaria atrata CBS 101060]